MVSDTPSRGPLNDVELKTFKEAVESTGHSIYWTDPDGIIEYVNPTFEQQTGYTAQEAIGQNANLLQSGEHDEMFYENLWDTILSGDVWKGIIINERKTGEQYIVKQTISPVTNEAGEIVRFVAVNEDITELRESQRQLEQERNRLDSLLNAVPVPLVLVTFEEGEPIVQQVNPAFEDVFAVSAQQLIGSSLDDHIVVETGSDQAQELNDRLRSGEPIRREVTRQTADGQTRTFLLEAIPLGDGDVTDALGTYIDITERTRAEAKQQLLTEVSQGIGEAETFRDGLERTLQAICEYTEWCCGEVWQPVDETHLEFIVGYADGDACTAFLDASESVTFEPGNGLPGRVYEAASTEWISDVSQEPPYVFHRTDLAADTGLRAAVGVPIEADDDIVAVLTFFLQERRPRDDRLVRDVSDVAANLGGLIARKQAEELIKRRNERLEEFADILGHDLRNPLNVATSRLELIADECDTPHLDDVETAHDRMQELIEDILQLARQGQTVDEMETIDLATAVEQCCQMIESGEAELTVTASQTIRGDESRVRQLLENLLRNAIDHGDNTVQITIGDLPDGFYVADDGPGIPAEDRHTVLTPGYTTREGGTGFGLAIVREIVEAHGWTITITDSDEGGAQFDITGVDVVDRS